MIGRATTGLAMLGVMNCIAQPQTAPKEECAPSAWTAIASQMPAAVSGAQWARVEKFSQRLMRICPERAAGYYWLGIALFRQGRTFASVRALRQALARKEDAAVHLALARAYFLLNQRRFVQEEIDAAAAQDSRNSDVRYTAARFYYETGQWQRAAGAFARVLESNRHDYRARAYLGFCLAAVGSDTEAEQSFRTAIQTVEAEGAKFDLAFRFLANFYLDRERAREAFLPARRAVEIAGEVPANHFTLGKVAWKLKDFETASGALEKAVALDPDWADAHYLLATVYRARGEEAKASREIGVFQALRELYGPER